MNRRTRASAPIAPFLISLVIGLASASLTCAQQPAASSVHFDVVSIKPSAPATPMCPEVRAMAAHRLK